MMMSWNREGADIVNVTKDTCRRCLIASDWGVVITVEVKMRQYEQGVGGTRFIVSLGYENMV